MNDIACPEEIAPLSAAKCELSVKLRLADEIHELSCRAIGLELAIIGASKEAGLNSYGDGLAQLAADVARGLEHIERTLLAEIRLKTPPYDGSTQ